MAGLRAGAHRGAMSTEHAIHLCTDEGKALCGHPELLHLSTAASEVTCLECRAFMALRALQRNLTERRLAATIARLAGQR